MKTAFVAGLATLSLLAGACATQPKPCTAEWVDWKTANIYRDFGRAHAREMGQLRELGASLNTSAGPGLFTMAALAPSLVGMVGTFVRETVPDIQSAIAQCGTAPKAANLFADLLRREGVNEKAVTAIERLGLLVETRT